MVMICNILKTLVLLYRLFEDKMLSSVRKQNFILIAFQVVYLAMFVAAPIIFTHGRYNSVICLFLSMDEAS